jgi:diguanylate cyclase (GGDEF)-like protein
MQSESVAENGQWPLTDFASDGSLESSGIEPRLQHLRRLRASLVCGMLLCVVTMLLDTLYLPSELLPLTVSVRFLAVFCMFAAALTATFTPGLVDRLDGTITLLLLVAAVGASIVAIVAANAGVAVLLAEPMIVVLGIYLLAGLPLRHSVTAAVSTLITCAIVGVILGTAPGFLAYALLLLAVANSIGALSCSDRRKYERELEASERRFEESLRRLNKLQNTDRLTGIYNRQMFDDHLARVWKQSRRERHNLGLLVVDIDHMREFNKRYGHPEGDRCIQRVGEALKGSVRRPLDFVARYDGSRFAMVLYDPPTAYIRRLVLNVQTSIAGLHIPNEGSPIGPRVTVSIGAVVLGAQTEKSLEGALQFAEEALSASKLRGRDRAVVFQSADLDLAAIPA